MTRYIFTLLFLATLLLAGCRDDFRYDEIGQGEAAVSATISFHPLIPATVDQEDKSRTPGNVIRNLRNIQVVVYKANNELVDIYGFGEGYPSSFSTDTQTGKPSDFPSADKAEATTATASFKIEQLPYGRYKMYVVANYTPLVKDNVQTPEQLMKHTAVWQTEVATNDQMFGVLATDNQANYDDAPVLTINNANTTLNGWVKRLASKLTIVYDGTGLHEGINIYVQKVSVRDIPRECVLNFNMNTLTEEQKKNHINGNNPTAKNQLIDEPENCTLYYHTTYQSQLSNEVDQVVTTDTDPNVTDWHEWLHITKSTTALGAVVTNDKHEYERDPQTGEIIMHTETMQSLFFYENCQGDYQGNEEYNKEPKKEDVGYSETSEKVYKDKVPFGTYIEVEGYYVSSNPKNQSAGPIKYRFMLGQNATYNYNALRNRHYKLFLKFRGYANQPEWHIVYDEEDPGLYPLPEFNVSYSYNTRHLMPIRMTGHPYKVTLQIIENNWAPYDSSQPDSVPPATNTAITSKNKFWWYRDLYKQIDRPYTGGPTGYPARNEYRQDYSPKPTTTLDGLSGYYYGLRKPSDGYTNGTSPLIDYDPKVEFLPNEETTPIWVGFLALQVPSAYDNLNTVLPTGIQNEREPKDKYNYDTTIHGMRNYYTGKGGKDDQGNSNNGVKQYQCTFDFTNNLPKEANQTVNVKSNHGGSETGRNAATLTNNGDGSYTLYAPVYTTPKANGYISGFTGNNPYEAYRRRAKILVTAYYKVGDETQIITERIPVFQQKRLVNPKAVWRSNSSSASTFVVKLSELPYPDANYFTQVESDNEWSAWIATPNNENVPNISSFVEIVGAKNGVYHGSSGSKVEFTLKFNASTSTSTSCGKVIIKYNGNNCEHAIYVRQGYDQAIPIVTGGKKWSSFSVFAFQANNLVSSNITNNTMPSPTLNPLVQMTNNPLALGTFYKRGNYGRGIRIINNKTWGVLESIGTNGTSPMQTVHLVSGAIDYPSGLGWPSIPGIIANNGGAAVGSISATPTDAQRDWQWSIFYQGNYKYDVPTYDDYDALSKEDFGIGVMYADGATETALTTENAYGYFNDTNTSAMESSPLGMRGIIVYNRTNFNQIFFPIGKFGVGRRTVQDLLNTADRGYLRYGGVFWRLSTGTGAGNQYRPIPYNMPSSPGALYWIKANEFLGYDADNNRIDIAAWDINYFDLSFNGYDAAARGPYGDAIPIKPVVTN